MAKICIGMCISCSSEYLNDVRVALEGARLWNIGILMPVFLYDWYTFTLLKIVIMT